MNTKQLKQKILSLAITGRLVPQDPSDESASELIYRINSKATLVQGDAPFDVPDSWSWCRLGRVCDIARGGSPRPIKKYLTDAENGVNWIKIGDTKPDDKYVRSVKQKIKPEGVSRSRFVHKGDFLLTNSMSFGRPYILDVDGCIHDGWLVISPKGGVYDKDFLYYLLSSPFAYDQFSREAGGGVVDNLNSEKVSNTVFPLPPLAEQKRIAEAVELWFAKIDQLEHDCEALSKFGKQVRKKLLTSAIAGRLVPQDPNDEPASELLHRINPKATPLETDQPLPQGWCATTLSTLCELTDGENVQNRELINLDAKFLRGQREGNKLKSGRLIPAGSLVILVDGENSGEVFKTPIEGYQGSTFKKLVIDKNMHEEFVLQVINSHRTRLKGNKKGSAIPHLNKKLFREIQVPIPPLAEQKRIVEKLESMFAVLDNLDKLTA